MFDVISSIIAYEDGELSGIEIINLFSDLIKSGMVWTLQGSYGRTANDLIDAEILSQDGEINQDKINELEGM